MTFQPPYIINHPGIVGAFKQHIGFADSQRVLFSGPFGSGKSTFLKKFFQENDEYVVLNLYPVNYSVLPNGDVFEFIKFDLLTELLINFREKIGINMNDFTYLEALSTNVHHTVFQSKNLVKALSSIIKPIAKAFSQQNETLIKGIDVAQEMKKVLDHNIEQIREDDERVLDRYFEWVQSQRGSIYEKDEITFLIIKYIENLKKTDENKKVVLLVDDLDRLDPEHIFRLFNIFSAHYSPVEEINKFGFDIVIFACDFDNIREMYKHRYGANVDFYGYVQKFYTNDIFRFDNRRHEKNEMVSYVLNLPKEFPPGFFYANLPPGVEMQGVYQKFDRHNYLVNALALLLTDLIDNKIITFRQLQKLTKIDFPDYLIDIQGAKFKYGDLHFLVLMHQIKKILPLRDYLNSLDALIGYANNVYRGRYMGLVSFDRWLIDETLKFIIDIEKIKPVEFNNFFNYTVENVLYLFSCQLYEDSSDKPLKVDVRSLRSNIIERGTINFYPFVKAALKACLENSSQRYF